ncbi:MAG: hypothetical protein HOO67_06325 [Candidatus Peribacteraceae bacterium]|nr:hypothetical protein [Candidatus Peribacteraceae bacterium]
MRTGLIGLVCGVISFCNCLTAYAEYNPQKEDLYVAVIVTEAAGESFQGKVAVAEVLRNRNWRTRGFVGLRRPDLRRFLAAESVSRRHARRAIRAVRNGSQVCRGATHYENVQTFGWPKDWDRRRMKFLVKIGQHSFYREHPRRAYARN